MSDTVLAVLFSGGTDSTYAAWSQIPKYDKIHLVTFQRKGLLKPENTNIAVSRLKKAFPDKEILSHYVDYEKIYQKVIPNREKIEIQQDLLCRKIDPLWVNRHGQSHGQKKYDEDKEKLFLTNECLQCKVAMYLAAIKFCKENDIQNLCDGSNTEQLDDGSQLEDVKKNAQDFFKRCGIIFFSPAFYISAEERCKTLYQAKITDHPNHKSIEKAHKIPSRQIQCTDPSAVLWTTCVFPWIVYDGKSCNDYVEMSVNFFNATMEKGLKILDLI